MSRLTLIDRLRASRFFDGEKPVPGPITLNQRRIFILPTERGAGFVVVIALLLLIAFVYSNNLAYLLGFLLASIFFITILHTYRSLSGLIIQARPDKSVFAGEMAGFIIEIRNPSAAARPQVQLTLLQTETLTIPANSINTATLYCAVNQRGWYPLGKLTLSSTFPLGFFRAWSPLRLAAKVLVYPKPSGVMLPFPETSSEPAQHGAIRKGEDEFYGLQSYQHGDNIKHIDWKTYAKGLGLFTKQFGSEGATEIWLDYRHTPGNSVEQRLSQLCQWIVDAEQAGISYGLMLPALKLAPGHGASHYQQCLEALALF